MALLRRRLAEAEDTIRAIREGQIDALVVSAPEGEQVYTLQSADQPYRLMVEQMHEGALTLSADGIVLYCNARCEELFGLPASEIVGQPFDSFFPPASRAPVRAALDGHHTLEDFQVTTPSGVSVPVQFSSSPLTIDGVRTTAVVISDLTPERTERALREANRLKDEFLATLSHELRTPLNVILGWTNMLRTTTLTERARRHAFELIDRNAKAQAQLVNDLVDMSRVITGKMRLDLQPVMIVPLVRSAIDGVRPAADAKSLTLVVKWDEEGTMVQADPIRLQQVIWNLLTNAVKFTPEGGRVEVDVRRTRTHVRIQVSDTGIGIAPSFVRRVFDRFRQAEVGTTRGYGGMGLGLSIAHDLVRLHGGDVEAHSEGPGRGAMFVVILPTLPRSRAAVSPRSVSSSGRARTRRQPRRAKRVY